MKIFVNTKQYVTIINEDLDNCKDKLLREINNMWLKTMFKNSIDAILKPHQKSWDTYGDKKIYQNILKQIGLNQSEIDGILNISFIYDENGNWDRLNKLNTNYSDIATLVVDIFDKEGKNICDILTKIKSGDKTDLKLLADDMKKNPTKYWDEYLVNNKEKYTKNNKKNSTLGDNSEVLVIKFFENLNCVLVYQAKEGSPIDTKLGIDLIFEAPNGKYFSVQVKTVGSISETEITPCEKNDITFTHKKIKGGYAIYTHRGISLNSKNIQRLAYVTNKGKILVVKKYSPISIQNDKCLDEPINEFPHRRNGGTFYIDHESVTSKNF